MRVLMLNQYYHPDVAATAQLAADLGSALAAQGHEVTAVASAGTYAGDAHRLPLVDSHRGVRILRVPATQLGRGRPLHRAVDYATFLAGALPVVLAARPDVVIALSTPPLVASLGLLARWLGRARLVYWVMDLYPEVAVRLGALREGGPAAALMAQLARLLTDGADAVVALDDAMRSRLIAAGCAADKISVIDNWVDGDSIVPRSAAENPLRNRLGVVDTFTVQYSGNMGLGHDLETLAEAISGAAAESIHWLLIGDGPRRAWLQRRLDGHPRVTWLPYQRREELPISLTTADVALVTLRADLAGLLVPSKLYGVLAAGVPLVYVGPPEGRVAEVVRDGRVGLRVANGDADGLVRAVQQLAADPVERGAMGRRARALFDACFSRTHALTRHIDLVDRIGRLGGEERVDAAPPPANHAGGRSC